MLSDRRTSHPYAALFGSGKAGQRSPRGDTPEVQALARRRTPTCAPARPDSIGGPPWKVEQDAPSHR
jgi:hypothetical protein